jgi:two-component system OmpR family sensor kinase
VADRLPHGGLRAQLAAAIAVITLVALGVSFVAVYDTTGSRLRSQLDAQLRIQGAEWRQFTAGADLSTPEALRAKAAQFIRAQRYHAESLILIVQVAGGPAVGNDAEAQVSEQGRRGTGGLLRAPRGLSTADVSEVGSMRVLTQPIDDRRRPVGTFRAAEPLRPVDQAQASLLRSFLIIGTLAMAVAIAAGVGLAGLIAAPLRRIARVAVAVSAGDLSLRAGPAGARGEARAVSQAFDAMLERLERAFTRQRDFVSNASHELRTPLTVLRAQVELLDREGDDQRRHQATTTLLARIDELDRLVGDMLTLASVEGGQLVEPREIDLGEFFEDVRRDLPLFGERVFAVEPVPGTLMADRDRLTQVLRNLVRNAVAHTEPGDSVTVTARARGDRLQIAIADSGEGIPADQLDRIFERFHRVDPGRSRDRGGTGLGLAIARAIIEAHGGTIEAQSTPGEGATFRIELPRYRSPRPAGRPGAGAGAGDGLAGPRSAPITRTTTR